MQGCIFCNKINGNDDEEHVVARSEHVFATLNKFPYNNGHLMIVPYAHIASQEDMSEAGLTDIMVMVNRAMTALRELYNPHAFNIGANIGDAAGAGIAAHFHFHVVPRWSGDANFMSTVGNTRVIPDPLEITYQNLKAKWQQLYPESNH